MATLSAHPAGAGARPCGGIMVNKPQDLWYVSFELPRVGKRRLGGETETFPNEREAKQSARTKLVHTMNITAGTLNPHLPKRTIAPMQIPDWIEEPNEADLA